MALYHKRFEKDGTETWLFFPGNKNRTPFKRRSVTVLMDDVTEAGVRTLISAWDLDTLSVENGLILCFPVPPAGGWSGASFDACKQVFDQCQRGMDKPDDRPLPRNSFGIPTTEAMMATWHPMNDTKYVIGVGSGASFALALAMTSPANIAAVLAEGGQAPSGDFAESSVPVCLVDAPREAVEYFRRVNGDEYQWEMAGFTIWSSKTKPWLRTMVPLRKDRIDAGLIHSVWEHLFSLVRRTNTCPDGDVEPSMNLARVGFEYFIDDLRLGDGKPHTWFTHVPPAVIKPEAGWPLVLFFHGGSDNPAEAAEMSKLHELGQREGFITVYPWGSDRCGWNSAMNPDQEDDAHYCTLLIDYMLANYPVDPQRVYLTGFSNGAAMAQTVALLHPEKVAALFHIDSNWPGKYGGYQHVTEQDITPFRLGFEKKRAFDYRMPVWYTYGSREISFPVYRDSTQQNQYDLWKKYNHIAIRPTPAVGEDNPDGCGAQADQVEILRPSARHPDHWYQVNRFFTEDGDHRNLYNFVIMHDKGHEVAQMDAELGWNYVKHYRRLPDGSLKEEEQA